MLRLVHEAWEAKVLRLKHPYVFDLIKVLAPHPHGLRRMIVLDRLIRNRKRAGLPIPRSFDSTVQSTLQYYCQDSDIFQNRNASPQDALFCWPKGKGAGFWGLMIDNARLWVNRNRSQLPKRMLGG